MSTSCNIGFYPRPDATTFSTMIYRHCDGYPTTTLVEIVEFLYSFKKARGNDISYAAAQLVYAMIRDNVPGDYLGYGLCTTTYTGLDYYYHISYDDSEGTYVVSVTNHNNKKLATVYVTDDVVIRIKAIAEEIEKTNEEC